VNFAELSLSEPILRAVVSEGYTVATPIQAQAIPHVLSGRDVLGSAQTGTGKTAAFALPILHRLSNAGRAGGVAKPRCLVLCPTRELATQIGESFRAYGKYLGLRTAAVFGGVGIRPQADVLRRGVDILIATPGRLMDLVNQRMADLHQVEILVLDEADRMLDMGFIPDVRKIIAMLPARKQTMLFSATMAPEIRKLANAILRDPALAQVAHASPTVDLIEQSVYFVAKGEKPSLLSHLFKDLGMTRALVFTRTKHGADKLVKRLHNAGIRSEAIHGNKTQNARQRALDNFKSGKVSLLVATDVASRGIDVDDISHVVNYDLTDEPETYVHRIGRTARAGASGTAISFCDPEERDNLRGIEKLLRKAIPVKKAQVAVRIPEPEFKPHIAKVEVRHPSHTNHAVRHASHTNHASYAPVAKPTHHAAATHQQPQPARGGGKHPHGANARRPAHAAHAAHPLQARRPFSHRPDNDRGHRAHPVGGPQRF